MIDYRADGEVVVLDFETTGLSAKYDQVIEVGAAIVSGNEIKSTFDSLCDPGTPIPSFITGLTGITNAMVKGKPSPEELMEQFHDYIGDRPILAHNASFDSRFLYAGMERVGKSVTNPLLCTMMLSRRLMADALDHKLGTLKRMINFQSDPNHQDHRALDDVRVTVSLWIHLRKLVETATGQEVLDFADFQHLSRVSKFKVQKSLDAISNRIFY